MDRKKEKSEKDLNRRRQGQRHSLYRCVGDWPLFQLDGARVGDLLKKVVRIQGPPQKAKNQLLPPPDSIQDEKKPKQKKKAKKKTSKKSAKKDVQPIEGVSSTFGSSSVRMKMAEIADIDQNYELKIAPAADIGAQKYYQQPDFLPKTVSAAAAAVDIAEKRNEKYRLVSTPGMFDDDEEQNRPKMYIANASYIDKLPDDEKLFFDEDEATNLIKEIFKDGIAPAVIASPIIEPAVTTSPSDPRNSSGNENDDDASFDILRRPSRPNKTISFEESHRDLRTPPSAQILRLRSGRTYNRSLRQNLEQTNRDLENVPNVDIPNFAIDGHISTEEGGSVAPTLDEIDHDFENLAIADRPYSPIDSSSSTEEKIGDDLENLVVDGSSVMDDKEIAAPILKEIDDDLENIVVVDGSSPMEEDNAAPTLDENDDDDLENLAINGSSSTGESTTAPTLNTTLSFSPSPKKTGPIYQTDSPLLSQSIASKISRCSILQLNPEREVYRVCQQSGPVSWEKGFPKRLIDDCVKIGEGCFGEVFRSLDDENKAVVLKVIPIEGDFPVNEEPQKSFDEILPEIVISKGMSDLRKNKRNATPNFVEVKKVLCIKGRYPERLLEAWNEFDERKESQNDDPSVFGDEQLFIVLVFADGGCDLENVKLQSAKQAHSIVKQLALTLAIAEVELEFEHRDLHIGNVLIKETEEIEIGYIMDGKLVSLASHGVHVFIIDFTNSRSIQEGQVVSTDLARDSGLFRGEGDYQFDIYRLMRDLNGNIWKPFRPKTNVFWLDYLIDKLVSVKKYAANRKMTKAQAGPFRDLREGLLENYESCRDLVLNSIFFEGLVP